MLILLFVIQLSSLVNTISCESRKHSFNKICKRKET